MHRSVIPVLLVSATLCGAACNGGERHLLSASSSAEGVSRARANDQAAATELARDSAAPAPALADEIVARALLAERFRAAGFRIRHDMLISRASDFAFTVDGFDPASRVGFEYVDQAERDTDLDPAERISLERDEDYRILVLDAAPSDEIERRAAQFLAKLEPAER